MASKSWILLFCAAVACGESGNDPRGVNPGRAQGKADEFNNCPECGSPPALAAVPDPRVSAAIADPWLLIGDGLTPDQGLLELTVSAPQLDSLVAWLGDRPIPLERADGEHRLTLDVAALGPGEYELLIAEPGADEAITSTSFKRSFALYTFVSIDWDGPDPPDANLERQERLHAAHPELLLTHLVGPYTFTAGLPASRVTTITDWVLGMQEQHGDEIGLHIHPYCHFVESAGVTCRRDPTFYDVEEARAGYTVFLFSYPEDEMRLLLSRAKELFVEHGLGTPTSFRAGAWAAQAHTLRALDAEGFVADGSAVNWPLLEEWEGDGPLFGWLRDNWGPIDAFSQPYRPNPDDALNSGVINLDLVEIPDNGALVDYVRADEMISVVDANLGDGPLERPRVVSIGYHVDNFSEVYFDRMNVALAHVDERLDRRGGGPVVYVRMSDLPLIDWNAL